MSRTGYALVAMYGSLTIMCELLFATIVQRDGLHSSSVSMVELMD